MVESTISSSSDRGSLLDLLEFHIAQNWRDATHFEFLKILTACCNRHSNSRALTAALGRKSH